MRITLVPSYGRDYKSKRAVLEAWNAGQDFTICCFGSVDDGRQVNKEDGAAESWNVRYNGLRSICPVN